MNSIINTFKIKELYPYRILRIIKKSVLIKRRFFRPSKELSVIPAQAKENWTDNCQLTERIIEFYKKANAQEQLRGNSMWQLFFNEKHKKIHETLLNAPLDQVYKVLKDSGASELFYGFDNLTKSLQKETLNPLLLKTYVKLCFDSLIRFAEILGAIPLKNPESPIPFSGNVDNVIQKIEKCLGSKIKFPNSYPNERGASSSSGIISYRAPQALYQAWRIKQLLKGIENPSVLEIGAGLGRTAYYSKEFGIKNYSIVDLPFTGISSAYFLGQVFDESQVVLSGEPLLNQEDSVKILTPDDFFQGKTQYDLIINIDSLTEMDPQVAGNYWRAIKTKAKMFLSINHEANSFTVRDLMKEEKVAIERSLYPMRNGYVEEIVQF